MRYFKPNYNYTWDKALSYPELKELGKHRWYDIIDKGEFHDYSSIADNVNNVNLDYDNLDPLKKERFENCFDDNRIELPLILKLHDNHYNLLDGNVRLAGLIKRNKNPKVWVINIESHQTDTNESTGADASGAFSAALNTPIKRNITNIPNFNINEEEEIDEVTSASSSGSYDVPLFGSVKGRKNPLKIDGVKSIKNSRAVTDKNFPKWGGPGGKFIKIKDKCKKFPYCNQGDINAIELLENKKTNIMKKNELLEFADFVINKTVKSILKEDIGKDEKYHLKTKNGKLAGIYDSKEEAEKALDEYKEKDKKELILSKGDDVTFDDIDEMTEEDCNECNTPVNENVCKKCKKEICECGNKVTMNESQMISFIKEIIKENESIEKNTKDAQSQSKKINDQYVNDVTKKVKEYLSFSGNTNPKFPNQIKSKNVAARQNNESEDDDVDLNRGRTSADLNYDNINDTTIADIDDFNKRVSDYLKGSSKTGNEQVDGGNTIPTDTGDDILKLSEKRKKAKEDEKLYPKEAVPVKMEKSKINEDILKMKKLIKY